MCFHFIIGCYGPDGFDWGMDICFSHFKTYISANNRSSDCMYSVSKQLITFLEIARRDAWKVILEGYVALLNIGEDYPLGVKFLSPGAYFA